MEPVYFVIERTPRGEMPAIYHDLLPERLTRKIPRDDKGQPCEPSPIVYAVRLDTLRGANQWLEAFLRKPLAELYAEYCRRRDGGALPASNLAGPPKKSDGAARRKIGEYWEPPKRTWAEFPPDPIGAAGEIVVDGKLVPGAVTEWQLIATAPKDGTEILGWNRHLGRHIVSWAVQPQHNPHPAWISSTCRINHIDQPTHWRPLPAPPDIGDNPSWKA